MNENPIMRQVANALTTIAFFGLLAFLSHTNKIGTTSLEYLLVIFTVGTSGVKLTKGLALGIGKLLIESASSATSGRWPAQRPPNEPPLAGPHDRTTTQVQRPSEPARAPWRDKPIPRDERRASFFLDWSTALLALGLSAVAVTLYLVHSPAAALAGVP